MRSWSLEIIINASGVQGLMGSRVGRHALKLARLLMKMGGRARGVDTG